MKRGIAFAVFGSTMLTAMSAFAACPAGAPKTHHLQRYKASPHNCVDLTAVPQISAQVVGTGAGPAPKTPAYVPPAATPYEGPTLGLTKTDPGVRPAPTIGYHWSLE